MHVNDISLNTPDTTQKIYWSNSSVCTSFSMLDKYDYLLKIIVKWKISKNYSWVFLFKKPTPKLFFRFNMLIEIVLAPYILLFFFDNISFLNWIILMLDKYDYLLKIIVKWKISKNYSWVFLFKKPTPKLFFRFNMLIEIVLAPYILLFFFDNISFLNWIILISSTFKTLKLEN